MFSNRYNGGWIEVICGCMFSGKTEELIRRINRAQIARQHIQVFQHNLDERYGTRRIASHSGAQAEATTVTHSADLLDAVQPETTVVAIDELQFFDTEITHVVEELASRNIRIIAAGLDMDFRGVPFGPMPQMMAIAELVSKLTAICIDCGAPATRTQRLIDGKPAYYDDPIILVGASEVYEARCRACHQVPRRKGNGQV